jgi:hypothetical protein
MTAACEAMLDPTKRDPARRAAWRLVFVVFIFIVSCGLLDGVIFGAINRR